MNSSLAHCRMQRRRVGYHHPWSSRCLPGCRVVYGGNSSDEFRWTVLHLVLVGVHSGGAGSQVESHVWRWVLLVW